MIGAFFKGALVDSSKPERQSLQALRYRSLFDSNIVGVMAADIDGNITAANDLFLKMVGYERADLPLRWDLMTPPEWRHLDEAKIRELAATGAGTPWEKEYLRKDGSRVPILVGAVLLEKTRGDCIALVLDLTERVRAEHRLLESRQELLALYSELAVAEERERRRIARGVHDEIGQILAMVHVRLGELRDEPQTADAGALEEVRRQVESAIRASRSLTFELSSALLYELGLEAALGSLAERYEKHHGLRVDFEADPQPRTSNHSAVAEDTAVILYRAVRELLWNVVRHAGAKSARVSLERVGDRVRITVEDDGAGFDAARASESFDESGGFGLFSLRQQLASMDGRLEVCSTAGEGSRVVVVAPAQGWRRGRGDSR